MRLWTIWKYGKEENLTASKDMIDSLNTETRRRDVSKYSWGKNGSFKQNVREFLEWLV